MHQWALVGLSASLRRSVEFRAAGSLENLHPAASAHAQATIAFLSDAMAPMVDGGVSGTQGARRAAPATAHSSGSGSGSSTDTAHAARPPGPQSPGARSGDGAAPRVRCGCGDTVEASAAVEAVFAGVVGRHEALLPRDSLRRILLQLQTLILTMTNPGERPGQQRQKRDPHAARSVEGGPRREMLGGARAGVQGHEDADLRCEHCDARCEDSTGGADAGFAGGSAGESAEGPHAGVCGACGRSYQRDGSEGDGASEAEGGRESGARVAAAIQGTTAALMAVLAGKLAQMKLVRCCQDVLTTAGLPFSTAGDDAGACLVQCPRALACAVS